MGKAIANREQLRTCGDTIVEYLKLLSQHSSREEEKNHENLSSITRYIQSKSLEQYHDRKLIVCKKRR
jgi:hypothetical protein